MSNEMYDAMVRNCTEKPASLDLERMKGGKKVADSYNKEPAAATNGVVSITHTTMAAILATDGEVGNLLLNDELRSHFHNAVSTAINNLAGMSVAPPTHAKLFEAMRKARPT